MLLSEVIKKCTKDKRTSVFLQEDKISLNYQSIKTLDTNKQLTKAVSWSKIKKLFLTNNNLIKLDGLGVFSNLTHLSLSQNSI